MKHNRSENLGIPLLKTDQRVFVTEKDKAETLNTYFFLSLQMNNYGLYLKFPHLLTPRSLTISPKGVAKQQFQFNPNNACGPDDLPARVLKEMSQSTSGWLAFTFQQSLNLNTVPSDWPKALITAVFRKDNKSFPSNYRPISLTSICCKVMEHVVLSPMGKHLSKNNIIIDQQHGFR